MFDSYKNAKMRDQLFWSSFIGNTGDENLADKDKGARAYFLLILN